MHIQRPLVLGRHAKRELNHVRAERDEARRQLDEVRAERDAGRRVIAEQESRNFRLNMAYGIAIDGLAEGHAKYMHVSLELATALRERDEAVLRVEQLLDARRRDDDDQRAHIDVDKVHDAIALHDEPDMERYG